METAIRHIVSEATVRARVPEPLKQLVAKDVTSRRDQGLPGASESEVLRDILYRHYGLDPVKPWQKD